MADRLPRKAEDIRQLLAGAAMPPFACRELADELVADILNWALNQYHQVQYDLTRSVTLKFGGPLRLRFNDAEIVEIDPRKLNTFVQGYAIGASVVKVRALFYRLFYNDDHVVIHRLLGAECKEAVKPEKSDEQPLSVKFEKAGQQEVLIAIGLQGDLLVKVMEQAAEASKTVNEWIIEAINHRMMMRVEPIVRNLPTSPPNGELFKHRANRREKAPEFIARVYGPYLTGDFTRADLRRVDERAEMGLRNWERAHGKSSLNLPTIRERNDKLISEGRLITDDVRETMRRVSAARNRFADPNYTR